MFSVDQGFIQKILKGSVENHWKLRFFGMYFDFFCNKNRTLEKYCTTWCTEVVTTVSHSVKKLILKYLIVLALKLFKYVQSHKLS